MDTDNCVALSLLLTNREWVIVMLWTEYRNFIGFCFAFNGDNVTAESGLLYSCVLDTDNYISFCCALNSDSGAVESEEF